MDTVKSLAGRLYGRAVAHRKKIIFAATIFLVSVFSFALGYIANREISRAPIIIEKCSRIAGDGTVSN